MTRHPRRRLRRGLTERTVHGLMAAMERAVSAEAGAGASGWLQRLDPRVKLAGLLAFVVAVALSHRVEVIAAILVAAVALAASSRVPPRALVSGVSLAALAFSFALAAPALVLTPGRPLATIPAFGWAITAQGLTSATFLVLRVSATVALGFVLVFTTRWSHLLKALRTCGVPAVAVAILAMTHRYVLLFLESAGDMFVARRSRTAGRLDGASRRRLTIQGAGVLLGKSMHLSEEVALAMQARGFRGDVRIADDFSMHRADWLALGAFAAVAAVAVWAGR